MKQERRQPGHETRDADFWLVASLGGLLVLAGIIILLATGGLFKRFNDDAALRDRVHPASPARPDGFPEPRLQALPKADLQAFQKAQETERNSYGWVDKSKGIVRIPVDRAMEIVLARGLPVRGGPGGGGP